MKPIAILILGIGIGLMVNSALAADDNRFAGDGGVYWVEAAPTGSDRPRAQVRPESGWFNDRVFNWPVMAPRGSNRPRAQARPDPGWFNDWGGVNWVYAAPRGSNKPMARVQPNLGGFIHR